MAQSTAADLYAPAADPELLLPARSAGRRRRARDPRLDGDAGAAARAAALGLRLLSSTRGSQPRGRQVLVPGVLGRLRQARRPTPACGPTLEGGDVLVLREDLLAIGYSERTEKTTIERLAESFKAQKSPIKRILVVAIPPARSYMHLDTVFTMISRDECLVYGPMILPDGAGGGRRLRVRPDQARDHVDHREGPALGAEARRSWT